MTENNAALAFLPDPGKGRFWSVELNPKSQSKPMVLKLNERYRRGAKGPKSLLNSEYVTANEKDIGNAAVAILERIGDYEKFLGEYDHQETS
ncbi:hypothetical protein SEA_MAGRITTE_119 [Microbacterium phage Magritte]|nr:hypothetical protein SEA_MAGRITTE_119 [Microbacterium phage Magritte]